MAPALSISRIRLGQGRSPLDWAHQSTLVFRSPRMTIVGLGEALRIEFGDDHGWAAEAVAAAEQLSALAPDALALAALPFDRSRPGALIVPEITLIQRLHGEAHALIATTDASDRSATGVPDPTTQHTASPRHVTVQAVRDPADWKRAVRAATERMDGTPLEKVVLFRELLVTTDVEIDPGAVLGRLLPTAPAGYAYRIGGFVGASPELLIARDGDTVRAHPMAGTLPRTGVPAIDTAATARLMASPKLLHEHQITIDSLADALLEWCSFVDSEPEPSVVEAASVLHLASQVEGRLSEPHPSVLELAAAVHPTPAVGGWPLDLALEAIDELELLDRETVAGPVGWVNGSGDGEFAVALRSALIDGTTARLLAGVGLVSDSDPDGEFAETQAKFQAVLPAIVRL